MNKVCYASPCLLKHSFNLVPEIHIHYFLEISVLTHTMQCTGILTQLSSFLVLNERHKKLSFCSIQSYIS